MYKANLFPRNKHNIQFNQQIPAALVNAFRGKNFTSPDCLGAATFAQLVDFALKLKQGGYQVGAPLAGKTVALVFFNPSLRTRASMSVAVQQLGGHPLVLDVGGGSWNVEWRDGAIMDGDKPEHIKEMAPVLGSYADLIAVRCFPALKSYAEDSAEPVIDAFARLSGRPIVNLESSLHHPCQALGDMLTIREHLGPVAGRRVALTWAYHPKALPLAVPNSFVSAAAMLGAQLSIVAPEGYQLDQEFVTNAKVLARNSGGDIVETSDREAGLKGAQVIYAKSWTSIPHYGDSVAEAAARSHLKDWIFDDQAFALAPKAHFMHCLPTRRNVEIADGVLDSPRSLVIPEAANRLHGQKALLAVMGIANWGLSS